MTNEEAIQLLDKAKGNVEAIQMAKSALSRLIPMTEYKNRSLHVCRICGKSYKCHVDFCHGCGQALKDWQD